MPIITAFPDPFRTYNRVEVSWADTPSVTAARVLRVNPATGECVPLRPYVCFEGDYLKLSCGLGVFWDTEVPLDTPVYYITEALDGPCLPSTEPFFLDTFSRTVVNGFGSTETGTLGPLPYTLAGGTNPGNYDVTAGQGLLTLDSIDIYRSAAIDPNMSDFDVYVDTSVNVLTTGAAVASRIGGRFTDTANMFFAGVNWDPSGALVTYIAKTVAGVSTTLAINFLSGTYTANTLFTMRFQAIGNDFKFKIWPTAGLEPAAWLLAATNSEPTLTSGRIALLGIRDLGNTNANAVVAFDNFTAPTVCAPCTPATVQTTESTMASGGVFRLKDPVRPCHDQVMPLCFTQPNLADIDGTYCIPGSGIFFAQMDTESYDSNSIVLNPVNAKYPIQVSRTRRGVESTLQVVTRTFADRDALLTLNEPGSPILIQAPPAYGIMDTYMAISTVSVERGLTDHKFQVRIINMPFLAVARPAGPMQGPCGSQMDNLCDIYDTWQELEASGLTWPDLIRGRASTAGGPGPSGIQTWNDVLADFVDWNAVLVGNNWINIEQGT